MKKLLLVCLAIASLNSFAQELVELHSSSKTGCAAIQKKSFSALEDFILSNNVKGNYTAVAIDDQMSGGCRIFVALQNSDFKLVSTATTIHGPTVWENDTLSERLSKKLASIKKQPSYVLHTVTEQRNSTMNKQLVVRSISIVRK